MNFKELKKEYSTMVNQAAAPQLNKGMLIDIMYYLESQHKATDKRTVEYKDSVQDTIDNQRKALEEAYAEIDRLKQSNEKFVDKNTNQIKIIQDAHEANKRLAKEKERLYILNIRHIADSQKDNEVMDKAVSKINQVKRSNEELVKDIKVLEDKQPVILIQNRRYEMAEVIKILTDKVLSDSFSE